MVDFECFGVIVLCLLSRGSTFSAVFCRLKWMNVCCFVDLGDSCFHFLHFVLFHRPFIADVQLWRLASPSYLSFLSLLNDPFVWACWILLPGRRRSRAVVTSSCMQLSIMTALRQLHCSPVVWIKLWFRLLFAAPPIMCIFLITLFFGSDFNTAIPWGVTTAFLRPQANKYSRTNVVTEIVSV